MEQSMYHSIGEVLQDVAAGRLTPEQADLEIERLGADTGAPFEDVENVVTDAQGIPFEQASEEQPADPPREKRRGITGIYGGNVDFDVNGSLTGIIGGCICEGVTIDGNISGPVGGPIKRGAHITGSISGPIGGAIQENVRIDGNISGAIGGAIHKGVRIGGNISGAILSLIHI